MLLLLILLLTEAINSSSSSATVFEGRRLKNDFSSFDCGRREWLRTSNNGSVISNGNDALTKLFQDWLYSWQNNCAPERCVVVGHNKKLNMGGIGRSLHYETRDFFSMIENGCLYRPDGRWLWAEDGGGNCTLGLPSIDCYFQPLTTCGLEKAKEISNPIQALTIHYNASLAPKLNYTKVLGEFRLVSRDSCSLAEHMNKSLQWVHGQVMHYITRPRADINETIQSRLQLVYSDLPANRSIIAVHYRGGDLDVGSKVANMSYYIDAIDKLAADLQYQGRPVDRVYICSLDQEKNIVSAEHMSSLFNRPWKYVVIPHYSVGEVEYYFKRYLPWQHPPIRKRDLFSEFISDVEIFAHADAFIGSYSNMYPLVASLRIARAVGRLNHSCVLDLMQQAPPLYCEGSAQVKSVWRHYFGGYNNGDSDFESLT